MRSQGALCFCQLVITGLEPLIPRQPCLPSSQRPLPSCISHSLPASALPSRSHRNNTAQDYVPFPILRWVQDSTGLAPLGCHPRANTSPQQPSRQGSPKATTPSPRSSNSVPCARFPFLPSSSAPQAPHSCVSTTEAPPITYPLPLVEVTCWPQGRGSTAL